MSDQRGSVAEVASQPDSEKFIKNAGLLLQHTGKTQKEYGHGAVLFKIVAERCRQLGTSSAVNVLELGTARGFSALVMARALEEMGVIGTILSVDIVRHDTPSYPARGGEEKVRYSRDELLQNWKELVERRIIFLCGSSWLTSEVIQRRRFPLIFIDEHHTYANTRRDLEFGSSHQHPGDVIVLDDYTDNFPGVVRAVDEFVQKSGYLIRIEQISPVRKMAVLTRNN